MTQVQPKEQEDRSILINFVLDKSGSMSTIRQATISGFNEFLGDQQHEGGSARMTLTLFDTRFRTVVSAEPLEQVTPLDSDTYEPSGMTALYDAIAHTMKITDDYVAEHKPDQVLFVIMTDGQENSSREFDRGRILMMIEDRQNGPHYEFIYLGANQDAYEVGQSIGVHRDKSLTYQASPEEARRTMTRVSHNVRAYRRHGEAQAEDGLMFSGDFESSGATSWEEHRAQRDAAKSAEAPDTSATDASDAPEDGK